MWAKGTLVKKISVALPVLLLPLLFASSIHAATQAQTCRKAVSKDVASIYKTVVQGGAKCFKARMADAGSQDCLDPVVFDEADKLGDSLDKLTADMSDTPNSACGTLGAGFFLACTEPPAGCTSECMCAQGSTGAQIAACVGCRASEAALAQVSEVYGAGLPAPDADAENCQNAIGKASVKSGRTRMKEQQSCQAAFDADERRGDCRSSDSKGKVAKTDGKSEGDVLKACLTTPGSDQVPELVGAACGAATAAGAADCAVDEAHTAVDEIFRIASSPAGIFGFVTVTGNDGTPLPLRGVRIEVAGANAGTLTDRNGYYEVVGIPPGNQIQVIDGQAVGPYPRIGMGFPAPMAGLCPMGIFPMPPIDLANGIDVAAMLDGTNHLTAPVTLSNPTIPGASLEIPMGTQLTFDVPNRRPLLSVSVVPVAAMPFPPDVMTDEIFTFQPEGLVLSAPVEATFPNNLGLSIGEQANVWLPDFVTNTFLLAGTATVQGPLGDTMTSDAPQFIDRFDWHFTADPNAPIGCTTMVIGRVINALTLAPIGNAQVNFLGSFTSTLSNGTFSFLMEVCPTDMLATAVATLPNGSFVSNDASVPTVFNATTDFGDIPLQIPDCGNAALDFGELCDDGGNDGGDGCGASCNLEICGDGFFDPPAEECDSTLGCSGFCTLCGNGILSTPGEECDAGTQNGFAGSGCSNTCRISICGNGIVEEGEQCDDGSANGGSQSLCTVDCGLGIDSSILGSLVRGAPECTLENNATQGGTNSCSPIAFESAFEFGPAGKGDVAVGSTPTGDDFALQALLVDVGTPQVTSSTGWRMRWSLRVTLLDGPNDVTLEDLSVETPMVLAASGTLRAISSLAGATGLVLSDYLRKEVELLGAEVLDPSDNVFARLGYLTAGAPALTADAPVLAGQLLSSFALAYDECIFPNATVNGLDACEPPQRSSAYNLSPTAVGILRSAVSGPDVNFALKLAGVLGADAITPVGFTDDGFGLALLLRMSEVDPVNGEMTVIDFPVTMLFDTPQNGRIQLRTSLNEALIPLIGVNNVLSGQAEIELISATLKDPLSNPFMHPGVRVTVP